MTDTDVKSTPLAAKHVELGARMVPFAGWNMPVQYTGILDEHKAVRETCGIFDISHMGQFTVAGDSAAATVQYRELRHAPNEKIARYRSAEFAE